MAKELINETDAAKLFSVKDKVILIIGAGGLGASLAKVFVKNGAYVIITNRTIDKANKIKEEMAAEGLTNVDTYELQIANKADVQAVVDDVVNKHGKIDVMWNTAAVVRHAKCEDFSEEDIRETFDINLIGAIYATQVVAKAMIPNNGGKIINVGSAGGLNVTSYLSAMYGISKSAVHYMTRAFALGLAEYNINVNCLVPTGIDTPMNSEENRKLMASKYYFRRMSVSADYAGAGLYLSSDASNYMSGHMFVVDGAESAGSPWNMPKFEE